MASVEPRVDATQYTVTVFPEGSINARVYDITVEWRGDGRWAVCRMRECLSADGEWSWESRPSEREDEWLASHRFNLDTALRLAREAAPHVVCNGLTALECVAWEAKRRAEREAQHDAA